MSESKRFFEIIKYVIAFGLYRIAQGIMHIRNLAFRTQRSVVSEMYYLVRMTQNLYVLALLTDADEDYLRRVQILNSQAIQMWFAVMY